MARKIGALILLLCLSILTGCRIDQHRRNAALSTVATALLDSIFRLGRATPLTQSTSRPAPSSSGETETVAGEMQQCEAHEAQDELPAPAAEEPRDVSRLIADCHAAGSSIDVIADDTAAGNESGEPAVEVPRKLLPTAVAPSASSRRVSVTLAEIPDLEIPELRLDESKIAAIVAAVSVHAGHAEAAQVDEALRKGTAQCRRVTQQIRERARAGSVAHKTIQIELLQPAEVSL